MSVDCYSFRVSIDVMLIPVTVRPGPDPQVAAFRDGDDWLRAPLEGAPSATAAALVDQLPAQIRFVLAERGIVPEPVAFKESRDGSQLTTLIYSIPVPMPFADPDLKDERWIDLLEPSTRYAEARQRGSDAVADVPRAETILEWWAERLEEQSALIAFLPRYFTARQARDVYSAFWGYDQDADRFAAWSGIGANKPDAALSRYVERELCQRRRPRQRVRRGHPGRASSDHRFEPRRLRRLQIGPTCQRRNGRP